MREAPTLNQAPSVGVVVVAYNGGTLLGTCVDALVRRSPRGTRVLLVDNGSSDGSVEAVQAQFPRVAILRLNQNLGFAGGANAGLRHLTDGSADRTPVLLGLVNQDCIVAGRWLEPLAQALTDPSIGLVGSRLLGSDGVTLEHAGGIVEANGLTRHIGRGLSDRRAFSRHSDVEYVTGAVVVMRGEIWKRFGPFDEGYFPAYFEEVDFCVRLRHAGLRIRYVPSSSAVHHVASASGGPDTRLYFERYHRSRMRFAARHLLERGQRLQFLKAELKWLGQLRDRSHLGAAINAYKTLPQELRDARKSKRSHGQ